MAGALQGKRAVVTAAGGGIGAAIATALAAEGASVAICDIDEEGLARVADEVRARGVTCLARPCDVGDPAQVEDFAAAVLAEFGTVDVLVNNAGTSGGGSVTDVDPATWRAVMAVNLDAAYLFSRAFVPGMRAQGWGRLIQIASLGGKRPFPHAASYSVSKTAVIALTRSMAMDYVQDGITSNAICPSWTRTDMAERFARYLEEERGLTRDGAYAWMASTLPNGRILEPEEVAAMVVVLARDDMAAVNGQAISVDGGAALS